MAVNSGEIMKVVVTIESDAYQYAEYSYATDKYSKVFDLNASIGDMLEWAKKAIGKPVPLGRLIISELIE